MNDKGKVSQVVEKIKNSETLQKGAASMKEDYSEGGIKKLIKNKYFILLAIIVLFFLFIFPDCGDDKKFNTKKEYFSFSGIKWNDSLDQIKKTLIDSGMVNPIWIKSGLEFTTSNGKTPRDYPVGQIFFEASFTDKWDRFLEEGRFEDNIQSKMKLLNKIKKMEIRGANESLVDKAFFYFTYTTDQLLAYLISIKTDTDTNTIKEFLIDKYGKPHESLNDGIDLIWTKYGQSLVLHDGTANFGETQFAPGANHVTLLFVNEAKIEKFIYDINMIAAEIEEGNFESDSKKMKDLL